MPVKRSRAESVAEAQSLRAEGLLLREIAQRMGAPISTVDMWINDPDLSKHRERRMRYGAQCVDCGAPTDGSRGRGNGSKRCRDCEQTRPHSVERARAKSHEIAAEKRWTDDELLDALREGDRRGLRSVTAWNTAAPADLPSTATIINRLGGWNRACELAGLPVNRPRRATYPRTSAAECVAALAVVWSALGQPPSVLTYIGYREIERPDLPSQTLVRNRVGTWLRALELAEQALTAEAVA